VFVSSIETERYWDGYVELFSRDEGIFLLDLEQFILFSLDAFLVDYLPELFIAGCSFVTLTILLKL